MLGGFGFVAGFADADADGFVAACWTGFVCDVVVGLTGAFVTAVLVACGCTFGAVVVTGLVGTGLIAGVFVALLS